MSQDGSMIKMLNYEDVLRHAWEALAPWVKRGKFTLRSGRESDLYVDVKGALLSSKGNYLVQAINYEIDAINWPIDDYPHFIGYGYGGAIMCGQLAGQGERAVVIRGSKKDHGLGDQPLGPLPDGKRPLCILEDVVTTEGSLKDCLRAISHHKFLQSFEETISIPIIAVVDRRRPEDVSLKCHSLFTEEELRQRAVKEEG